VTDSSTMQAERSATSPDLARRALAGGAASLAGLAAAELVALVLPGSTSPTTAVAERVVELTPDGPREALIGLVGTADKPLLVAGIVLVVVLVGALVAALARPGKVPRAFAVGAALGWALTLGGSALDAVLGAVVVGTGYAVALGCWNLLSRGAVMPPSSAPAEGALERREFLRATALVAAVGALGLGAATVVRRTGARSLDAVRAAVRLPKPTSPAPPLPQGIQPAQPPMAPAVTPNADFYQIDTALVTPVVGTDGWQLAIDGRVSSPLTLSYDDLLALPSIERTIALTCVSNEVGGDLVGTATWQGVRLADLLERVGVRSDADALVGESVDGFTAGFPLSVLADGRDAMVAYAMNGEPLPVKHGFPARLVVPGLYGYVSATKWLAAIRLTTLQETVPFWLERGWAADGTIELASRIDVPRTGAPVAPGRTTIGGRAWQQHVGVDAVQVRIDGGPWEDAVLADSMGADAWRLWSFAWDAEPGRRTIEVRARAADGAWQDEAERPVFPGAASGLHRVVVDVR